MCWRHLASAANEVSLASTSTQRRLLAACLETLRLQHALESLGLDVDALRDGTERLAAVTAVTTGAAATGLKCSLCASRRRGLGEVDLLLRRRRILPHTSTTLTTTTTTTSTSRISRHFY